MRPLRLQLKGFGAFREPEDIDFSGIDYLALVGPTGSGKSTVIDAMCFALYGAVPRYADQRRVGYIVTTGATEARVSFTFESGGRRYVATRVVQRKPDGRAVTREARLETVDDDGTTTVVAGSVTELDEHITKRVLGMPFDHFTRCVVLPQGDFARFLSDKPRERQDMLVNLLGLEVYGRMGQRAHQLKANREGQALQLRARAETLAFATPEAAEAAAARVAELGKLHEQLGEAAAEVQRLERGEEEARAWAAEAETVVRALDAVTVPDGVAEVGHRMTTTREADRLATEAHQAASDAVAGAADTLAALGDKATIVAAVARHEQFAALTGELAAAKRMLTETAASAAAATRRSSEAAARRQEAEERLDGARAARAAAALAERLVAGEPCPVCLVEVRAKPEHPPAPALDAARAAVETAKGAAVAAAEDAARAVGREAAQDETRRRLEAQLETLRVQVATLPAEGQLRATLADIEAATRAVADARRVESEARAQAGRARAEREQAERAVDELWVGFDRARDAVAALGPPLPGRRHVAEDWEALAAWAAGQAPARRRAGEEALDRAKRLRAAAGELLAAVQEACLRSGVDVAPAPDAAPAGALAALERACLRARAGAEADSGRIREALAEAAELARQAAGADEEAVVAKDLARRLSTRGFERWILSEVVDGLVAGASVILRELSTGAYSLVADDDGDFWVVDHRNADERRSAKTLSGGETFQASLALALALADQLSSLAAAGAARIEATFIDEGFGSLDDDTLDTVAGTLENLGGDDRLVGVVTHVRALADRVPVRLEVTKGPRSSSVTKVVA